jgi:hypothetical protein
MAIMELVDRVTEEQSVEQPKKEKKAAKKAA